MDVPHNSRRAFLALCGVGVLSACTPATPPSTTTSPAPSASTITSPAPSATMSPTPTETPRASPSTTAAIAADIEREFAGARPSEWGMAMAGILSRTSAKSAVLTFDACGGNGGSGVDADLLNLLRKHKTPATLFFNQRWVKANLALAKELAADDLFEIANHGTAHVPLSVTRRRAYGIAGTDSPVSAWHEVADNTKLLEDEFGISPRFFRSGTAHYDDVAVAIAKRAGQVIAGFSINGDAGATASKGHVVSSLSKVRSGDIVLAHMNQPSGQTAEGFALALPRALDRGVRFTTLADAL